MIAKFAESWWYALTLFTDCTSDVCMLVSVLAGYVNLIVFLEPAVS